MCDELILTFADVQINVQLSDANELRGPHSNACGQTTHLRANRTGENTETISVRPKSIMECSSPDLTHRRIEIKPSIDLVGIASTVWTPNQDTNQLNAMSPHIVV